MCIEQISYLFAWISLDFWWLNPQKCRRHRLTNYYINLIQAWPKKQSWGLAKIAAMFSTISYHIIHDGHYRGFLWNGWHNYLLRHLTNHILSMHGIPHQLRNRSNVFSFSSNTKYHNRYGDLENNLHIFVICYASCATGMMKWPTHWVGCWHRQYRWFNS